MLTWLLSFIMRSIGCRDSPFARAIDQDGMGDFGWWMLDRYK